jgi:hypothetical protein
MSGLRRACAVMAARSLNGAFPQVTGGIACSELVVRDRIELSTFRFSALGIPAVTPVVGGKSGEAAVR